MQIQIKRNTTKHHTRHQYLLLFILSILITTTIACVSDEDTTPQEPPISLQNRILPLGASRVEGARPIYESFRYELWKELRDNDWSFDFIGTQSDNAPYPTYNGEAFDTDHEGRGGWTSGQILNELDEWLSDTGSPDIVLFSSPGGNDILGGLPYDNAIANINSIIDLLQDNNPNVSILIEQLAPGRSDFMTTNFITLFEQMKEDVLDIATNQTTSTSKVIAVNMYEGFNDGYLADDVHYNEAGADLIATRYYNALTNVLEN